MKLRLQDEIIVNHEGGGSPKVSITFETTEFDIEQNTEIVFVA